MGIFDSARPTTATVVKWRCVIAIFTHRNGCGGRKAAVLPYPRYKYPAAEKESVIGREEWQETKALANSLRFVV